MAEVETVICRIRHAFVLALMFLATWAVRAQAGCQSWLVTGYTADVGPRTADGTPTAGNAWQIAAAPAWLPFGSLVEIEDVGIVRIADRGRLGRCHLDLLVSSRSEAYALTGDYRAEIVRWGW